MHTKSVNVSDVFQAAGIRTGLVVIQEADGMYPHKKRLSDNWSYFTAASFKCLHDHKVFPETIAIVGIGSGVEGVAAAKVFARSLRNLVITDVDEGVVNGALANITSNLPVHSKSTVQFLVGSFCEPLTEEGIRADLIHANIPNLPAVAGADLSGGAEKGTFLRPELYEGYQPPDKYISWALGAQYAYIHSARKALTERGSVITEVGGRVPLPLLKDLFEENGFKQTEVLVGFKEQTEALMDFIGYHAFEEEYGVEFDFYLYEAGLKVLRKYGVVGNISKFASGDELKELLTPHRVTAGEAVELYHQKIAVGHTVHILKGSR